MPLPITFGGLSGPIPLADLDANFAALGALTAIPCLVSGTNALTLTPAANTPTISGYFNYQPFTTIAVATNTGAVTAVGGSLAVLSVFKNAISGPAVLSGGEIVIGNLITLLYDAGLNSGAGGFHLTQGVSAPYPLTGRPTVNSATGVTLTAAQLTGSGAGLSVISRTGAASGDFNDTTDTATAILAALPGAIVGSTFRVRMSNATGHTQTLLGGSNVTVVGTATTANATTHEYEGVITAATPTISFYG